MNAIDFYKKQFFNNHHDRELSAEKLHFNNAGLAPISLWAKDKINYWSERFYREGFFTDADYMEEVAKTRDSLAKLFGGNASNIAFFQNASNAISQVVFQFPWNAGDEILAFDCDYSSVVYPLLEVSKRFSCSLTLVPSTRFHPDLDQLLSAIKPQTKMIVLSWVQFQSGTILSLEQLSQICREKNIFLLVDAMQGLGLHPLDLKKLSIDALVGGSHKWLVSPVGLGFLHLDSKWHGKLKLHNVGSGSYGTCDDPMSLECIPKLDASKFESGAKQVLEITALGASVDLILQTGVEAIESEVLKLSHKLHQGLIALNYDTQYFGSSIVTFVPRPETEKALKGIACVYAKRGIGIRLSPHAFNTDREIDKILSALS